jgi:6-pyruvoyltetrahydropterin/6-carboxytetrahydropterin synthase
MKVGVVDHFDSMHRLPGHPKCGVPHGHTYKVEAIVEGDPVDGMVIDFDHLKRGLREALAALDHTDLNRILEFPSCENLALEIHRKLAPRLGAGKRLCVRIWEGDGKWAEYEA